MQKLVAGSEAQQEFDSALLVYQEQRWGDKKGDGDSDDDQQVPSGPHKLLTAHEDDEYFGESVVGVHWPLGILKRHPETKHIHANRVIVCHIE